jgi:hypothetical protein
MDCPGYGVRFPIEIRDFSPLHVDHTGYAANPASYVMGAGAIYLRVQRQGREAEQLLPSSYPCNRPWRPTDL